MTEQECYRLSDYILNHYDRNSHLDKLVLAKDLKKKFDLHYNNGINTAICLLKDTGMYEDANYTETLICGLESSKL